MVTAGSTRPPWLSTGATVASETIALFTYTPGCQQSYNGYYARRCVPGERLVIADHMRRANQADRNGATDRSKWQARRRHIDGAAAEDVDQALRRTFQPQNRILP